MMGMLLSLALAVATTAADNVWTFRDGDRVIWLGGTLIEREQESGYWETALTVRNRDRRVTFRNLGWSGDTVWGESRNGFDESPKGFEQLVTLATELKPTVLVICYGQNESFAGEAGLTRFRSGLNQLLDALAPTKGRVVLLTPTPFENPGDVARNALLGPYAQVVREVAGTRRAGLVDLFTRLTTERFNPPITDNGLHPTPDGYRRLSSQLWGPASSNSSAEILRAKIVAKNRLFFHRWRPQNETYLFGFRKHEQGKNAVEVAAFDPLVASAEADIQKLLKNMPRHPSRP